MTISWPRVNPAAIWQTRRHQNRPVRNHHEDNIAIPNQVNQSSIFAVRCPRQVTGPKARSRNNRSRTRMVRTQGTFKKSTFNPVRASSSGNRYPETDCYSRQLVRELRYPPPHPLTGWSQKQHKQNQATHILSRTTNSKDIIK